MTVWIDEISCPNVFFFSLSFQITYLLAFLEELFRNSATNLGRFLD